MKTLITAITTASLLLVAGPALADRDDRHHRNDRGLRNQHIQQQRDHHNKVRDIENRRKDARNRDEDRRKNGKKDDHRYLKYVGYDSRYDKNRHQDKRGHDKGRGNNHRKPQRPVHRKPQHRPHQRPHKHRWRPAHYGYGYRWKRLPSSYVSLTFGGLGYYFSDGIFYRPYGAGYTVAHAPVGALVQSLPATAVTVSFNGLSYFTAYDTYYRWDNRRSGYLVVANPGF